MIHISPETPMASPNLEGLRTSDSEWRLEVTQYETFIQEATGMSIGDDLTAADCYRIGNRLEALIDERQQDGEWTSEIADAYPDIRSRAEIIGLARFFRECHTCCLDAEATT